MAETLAATVVAHYQEAERQLLARIARNLARGIDSPTWVVDKLAQMKAYRREAQALLRDLEVKAKTGIGTAITDAYSRGGLAAVADMAGMGQRVVEPLGGLRAVQALASETIGNVVATHPGILRSVMDVYRSVIAESSSGVLLGNQTRRQAAQTALNRFARKGITGFVDKAGRGWSMESYAEMATRTGCGRAAVQGHVDRLTANGLDLVIVSDAPKECPICREHEGHVYSLSGASAEYPSLDSARAAGLFHVNCFPAGVRVSGPAVRAADTRWYEGELVVIGIAGGDELPVTPNHPILTPGGWVAAGLLTEGTEVVHYLGQERMRGGVGPDDVEMPSLIEEIPAALVEARSMVAVSVPVAAEQFHGDGYGHGLDVVGEVDVVLSDSLLRRGGDSLLGEPSLQRLLGSVQLPVALHAEGALAEIGVAARRPSDGIMGSQGEEGALCWSHARQASRHGLSASQSGVSVAPQSGRERRLTEADGSGGLPLGLFTSEVSLNRVVEVRREHFAGHVYNLQTVDGWYSANGIVSHNCRHGVSAYQEGITKPMGDVADPSGYEATVKLRYLERQTRAAKRVQAAAMDEAAKKAAGVRVRAYQSKIRAHVATTSAKRSPHRERLGAL